LRLNRAVLINWGTIPSRTFEFIGTTALTGETGAGKTSVIDGMITVMTGGSSRLGRLNSASDDGKGVRRRDAIYRTIEGYVLGGHNKLFARESAHAYVALTFEPEDREKSRARPFTAVLAASAILRRTTLGVGGEQRIAEIQEVFYLIIDGTNLSMSDFVAVDTGSTQEVIPVEAIGKHLKDKYPNRRTNIEISVYRKDQHADYLRRLYGDLEGRGEVSLERAHSQATVWSRFVGQEHIDDISQFVRQFVLSVPADFTELEKIGEGVRSSRRLNEQAKLIVERLGYLERALHSGEGFGRQAITAKAFECSSHQRAYNDAVENAQRASLLAKEYRRKSDGANASLHDVDEQLAALHSQEVGIQAKLLGVPSYQRVQDLEADLGVQDLTFVSLLETARTRGGVLGKLASHLSSLQPTTDLFTAHKRLSALISQAASVMPAASGLNNVSIACHALNPQSRSAAVLSDLKDIASSVEASVEGLRDILCSESRPLNAEASSAIASLNNTLDSVTRQITEKKEDISRIEHGNSVSYPRLTHETVEYLKSRIAKAEPAVLCDLVTEVRDESWQSAIEGYIGGSRFGIIVKPEYEPEVNVLLQARRRDGKQNAAVIQGFLALKEWQDHGSTVPPDSIVHELIVDNPYAKAYLYRQYGNVIKVQSADELHKVRNGVTRLGRGSGSYRTFDAFAEAGDLTFGKRARERRKEKRREELKGLEERLARLNVEVTAIAGLAQLERALEGLQGKSVAALCQQALVCLSDMKRIREQIKGIDLSASADLQALLAGVTEKTTNLKGVRDEKFKESVASGKDADDNEATANEHTALALQTQSKRTSAVHGLTSMAEEVPWVDTETILRESDASAVQTVESVQSIEKRRSESLRKLTEILGSLRSDLGQYNAVAATAEDGIDAKDLFAYEAESSGMFTAVSKIVTRAREIESALRTSQLARLHVEIEKTTRILRSTFSTHFCNRLLKEIENGDAMVRALNGELLLQKFGRDSYRFQMDWNTDAYRNRHGFFFRIREKSADENFDMFADGALDRNDIPIRDELLNLFLDAAGEGGKSALMQVADYRQYRRYDLLKVMTVAGKEHESSISLQMTDSGGEKETGLFIARVATVTGGLGLREPGPHLRTVVIDELFKKTDEPRIRTAVEYLTGVRELHVIFAMPTRAIGPFKDIIDSEYALTRMQSDTLNGELDHFVIVEHHAYNKDAVEALRDQKRTAVRKQAEFEFEAKERGEALP